MSPLTSYLYLEICFDVWKPRKCEHLCVWILVSFIKRVTIFFLRNSIFFFLSGMLLDNANQTVSSKFALSLQGGHTVWCFSKIQYKKQKKMEKKEMYQIQPKSTSWSPHQLNKYYVTPIITRHHQETARLPQIVI